MVPHVLEVERQWKSRSDLDDGLDVLGVAGLLPTGGTRLARRGRVPSMLEEAGEFPFSVGTGVGLRGDSGARGVTS